jgi:hypothetical protein
MRRQSAGQIRGMEMRRDETPPPRNKGIDAAVASLPGNGLKPGCNVYAKTGCRTR